MDRVEYHPKNPDKVTVCLFCEGTYPYVTGGVSSWIQDIISGLSDFNFIIYAILAEKPTKIKYNLPENVISITNRVLIDPVRSKSRKKIHKSEMDVIKKFHEQMIDKKEYNDFEKAFRLIHQYKKSLKDLSNHPVSWELITRYNSIHNPLYPFSDYYWAWKASHETMTNILSWEIPEADLYHTISTGYAGLSAAVAKILYKKSIILTEHGLYNKEREIDIKRARWVKGYQRDIWINVFNGLSKITYDHCDLIVSLFAHNRQIQISQGAQAEKTMVIPNGIDIERFLDLKKESRKDFSIGLVGRVVPIKDIKNFIIACKIVAERIPNVKFFIIGPRDEDEKYNNECQQLVENFKFGDKMVFTGRSDVREFYSFLDVLVLTSVREAQPLVIIEGYLAGIPVISTRVGNVPDMLKYDQNLLADPKDSEKIASGIIKLYEDKPYREKLVKENREMAIKNYDKKDLIEKYRNIYNSYAANQRQN